MGDCVEIVEKIGVLYTFVEQGSICASEEYSRVAFELVKRRIEKLFPEFFEDVKEPSKEEQEAQEAYSKLEATT